MFQRYLTLLTLQTFRVVFSALPELEYVAVPTLRGVGERDILENHLASVFLQANEQSSIHRSGPDDVVLWIATPTSVLGRFGVRKAAPEDYDDLVPIFDQQAEFLQKKYPTFLCLFLFSFNFLSFWFACLYVLLTDSVYWFIMWFAPILDEFSLLFPLLQPFLNV